LRGASFHQSLLFNEYPPAATPETDVRLGRSASLISQRNDKIACRYYYKIAIKGMKQWDEIITQLSFEFDLSTAQVVKIITLYMGDRIRELCAEKPTVKELRRLYPHYSW